MEVEEIAEDVVEKGDVNDCIFQQMFSSSWGAPHGI